MTTDGPEDPLIATAILEVGRAIGTGDPMQFLTSDLLTRLYEVSVNTPMVLDAPELDHRVAISLGTGGVLK